MTIFVNDEKGTYYHLDPETQSIGAMGVDYYVIRQFPEIPIQLIHVENYKAILKFRRILEKGEFSQVRPKNLKQAIMDTYPEMFL